MNQSDFDFNTNIFNRDIKHDLKVGFKFHYDKINRDQYVRDYTQATTGVLTPVEQHLMLIETKLQKVRPFILKKMQQLIIL